MLEPSLAGREVQRVPCSCVTSAVDGDRQSKQQAGLQPLEQLQVARVVLQTQDSALLGAQSDPARTSDDDQQTGIEWSHFGQQALAHQSANIMCQGCR